MECSAPGRDICNSTHLVGEQSGAKIPRLRMNELLIPPSMLATCTVQRHRLFLFISHLSHVRVSFPYACAFLSSPRPRPHHLRRCLCRIRWPLVAPNLSTARPTHTDGSGSSISMSFLLYWYLYPTCAMLSLKRGAVNLVGVLNREPYKLRYPLSGLC